LAEILFLRRQLALYQERQAKARRPSRWSKLTLVWLSKLFDLRNALLIVQPEAFIRWYRAGFRLLWRWKSRRRGRPALPKNIRELVRQMASKNPSWGEERIAAPSANCSLERFGANAWIP
jgi:putative transposase